MRQSMNRFIAWMPCSVNPPNRLMERVDGNEMAGGFCLIGGDA